MNQFLYLYNYDENVKQLSKIETQAFFQKEDDNKILFSDIEVEPSHSAFIKKRVEILLHSPSYTDLLYQLEKLELKKEGFKVEYLQLNEDKTRYTDRLSKLKDIGYRIEGSAQYKDSKVSYSICYYHKEWYFGILIKNSESWTQHNKKPYSYSNSINVNIAKAMVNIAGGGNKTVKMLDACCGVGTILLEACYAGYKIEGCDINWKVCRQSRMNLAHFGYKATVHRSDIKDLDKQYDVALIDLPYNLFSKSDDKIIEHIILCSSKIASKLIIVSTTDIKSILKKTEFKLVNFCSIQKNGNTKFERKIWVYEA